MPPRTCLTPERLSLTANGVQRLYILYSLQFLHQRRHSSTWCIVQLVVVLCSWNKSKVRARKRGIVSNYSNGFRVGKTGPFIHECSRSSKITFFTNFVCNLYILIVWWSFGKLSVLVTRFNVEYRCSAICLFQTSLSIQIVPTYHSRESSHTSIPIPPSLSFIPWCLKSLPIVMLQMKLQYLLTTKATSNSLPRTAKSGAKDFYFLTHPPSRKQVSFHFIPVY